MTEKEFYQLAFQFLEKIFLKINAHAIVLEDHWDIDHLCYRVETVERYTELKNSLMQFTEILIESPVNGRLISTFKLRQPLQFKKFKIDLVELPAPKPNKMTPEGFEHIEIVCDVPFSDLINRYPQIALNQAGLNKEINQELEFCLGDVNLKFHHLSLESVIEVEKNPSLVEAFQNLELFSRLKKYQPLIAGSFPLGLQNNDSDVDILLQAQDLKKLEAELRQYYGNMLNYLAQFELVDGLPTLVVNFQYQNRGFEFFAQDCEPVRQRAYLHFLIEERLLKWGGATFKRRVLEKRQQGLKTEPAFAEVLAISTDPYQALLELQKKSILF